MFQNSYQNGTYFDLFDPKVSQDKIKNLYKISNVHGNNKLFDKQLKTYVLEFNGTTSRISFPKQQKKDLYLIQQYLVFQIFFFPQMSWNIQLAISDLTKTKRRIILSSTTNKIEVKPFFVKIPCLNTKQGVWNTFAVDLFSYIEAFKGQTYRSLDSIYITGHFKLRRIYTSSTRPIEDQYTDQYNDKSQISFLPKNFYYPPDVLSTTKVMSYEADVIQMEHLYQPTEPSTKNSSNIQVLKKGERKFSTSKTNVIKSQKLVKDTNENILIQERSKKFLANTNGPQMVNRKKNIQRQDSSEQSQTQKSLKTPGSVEKGIKRKNLTKTQIAHKMKSSIEKKKQDKTKTKAKLNPWRTNIKDVQTDGSQLQISKHQERNLQSPQTTLFKTKNNLASKFNQSKNKGFDKKSEQYSDSQYFQLSQKFSTLTDGKFFKNQLGSNFQCNQNQHNDQIEQNIQMETNSMYQSKKEQSPNKLQNQQIAQSICDSLEKKETPIKMSKSRMKNEFDFRNSHYGFGENLMKKFMGEVQRPYSPPLGQRQTIDENQTDRKHLISSPQKEEVELIYDPVLNCYYDHKTHTYYQLKN